jgi:ribosomal protein S6
MSEDNRTYELGYILVPTVPEQEVATAVASLKSALAAVEGTVLSEGEAEFIDLAYQIEKNVKSKKMKWNQGYFGWIKFTAAPEALEALKKSLDANLELMRYMLIKTDAENNVVFKKPKVEAVRGGVSFDDIEPLDEDVVAEVAEPEQNEGDKQEVHETLPDVAQDMTAAA